ncbi:hypothetical protein N7495_004878 [Penicillium taxi]|uniref:uncharacterized protein n=1 Tax=Penicillium taxi TaxID=168475 RepID=UPI0025458619|nr:uncharacterized protein N7495_004878 [Penicillium taxi]KAJ5900134.1 hypothetical protein N7495_004878 [Penicillium taxi]
MDTTGFWNAYGIIIAWQSSDSIHPATATATFSTLTPTATATATATTISQEYSSRLSSGAKAGIGVGVALGVILVLLTLIFLYIRRQKRLKREVSLQDQSNLVANPTVFRDNSEFELAATGKEQQHKMNSDPVHEIEGLTKPLSASYHEPFELDGRHS